MKKTAVVTGGASGLGLAVAERFAGKGMRVVIIDVSADQGAKQRDRLREAGHDVQYLQADLTNQSAAAEAAEEAVHAASGRIDVLVNAAGIIRRKPHADVPADELDAVLDINLNGTVYMCQAVYPYMRENGGAIVNFASMLAHYGSKNLLAYAASKGGVVQVTKCLAVDWASDGIRVNAVSPGYIETPLSSGATRDPAFRERILSRTPQRRFGQAHEVASAIDFLCSEDASFITGVVLPIDGGLLAGDPSLFPPA
jgi:NAD(P)-dependent dehydrogenase (short-subunit alcohol dehydrogenase family)